MTGFIEVMVKLAPFFGEITAEERNLFSAAYKNLVGPRRAAYRIVYSIEEKEVNRGSHGHAALIKDYRLSIQSELSGVCGGILALLNSHLIPFAISIESKVFYIKMKGDYYRYLAEIEAASEGKKAADSTQAAYTEAQDIALVHLAPTHPLRLGLALNFAVYHYEILNSSEKACRMAKQAFEEAIAELDSLGEKSYKDSLLILQLLHDNLTLWTSEAQDQLNEP